jgi:hypothetical protein
METICDYLNTYTSEDFKNWLVGLGTLAIGIGTIGIAYAGLKTIPEKFGTKSKNKELIKSYQQVIYRMYKEVVSSGEGVILRLPKDIDKITKIMIEKHPQIGSNEDAICFMDDLMEDDYFKSVQGNATVMKTAKWNSKNRKESVKPKIEDLPPEN